MSLDETVGLGLALLALASYAVLFALRVRHDHHGSRLLFVDLLLLLVALEIVADDLHWHEVALLTRGAFVAGGVALLWTGRKA